VQRSLTTRLASSLVHGSTLSVVGVAGTFALAACGAPPPAMVAGPGTDGVPANSASEARLASDSKPKPEAAPPADDAAQPFTTPVNGDPGATGAGATAGGNASATPAGAGGATAKGTGKGGKGPKVPAAKEPPAGKVSAAAGVKVTKAECKQLFDKYIDLTIGSDERFAGIPPEMVAQMKDSALAQAQSEKGDPCSSQEVTRAQYTCAIASTSTVAWQRCMK
jgi:hypothetical protein